MATLYEYFKVDFANALGLTSELETFGADPEVKINVTVGIEAYSNAKFVAYHIPEANNLLEVCYALIASTPSVLERSKDIVTIMSLPGEVNLGVAGSENSVFSNRFYI